MFLSAARNFQVVGGSILLVDDEVAVRNFYEIYFEHHGFRVHPASGPVEALRLLSEQKICAVIVDIFLGGENGLDLVRQIRALWPEMPVIVISGVTYDEPVFLDAIRTGADGFYSKTLPMSQLLMDVRRVMRI